MIGPGYRFLELGEGWRCWRRTKPSIVGEGFEQDGFAWCRKLRVEVIVQSLGQPLYGDKGRMNTATWVFRILRETGGLQRGFIMVLLITDYYRMMGMVV